MLRHTMQDLSQGRALYDSKKRGKEKDHGMAVEAKTTDPPGGGGDRSPGLQSAPPGTRAGGTGAGRCGDVGSAPNAPPLTTPTPAVTQMKTGFLGGLSVKELATRVVQEVREDDCLGGAAQLAYYLLFAVFPFLLFLTALLGFLPIPNLMERSWRRSPWCCRGRRSRSSRTTSGSW